MMNFILECITLFFKVGIGFLAISILFSLFIFFALMVWKFFNVELAVDIPEVKVDPPGKKDEKEPRFKPNKIDKDYTVS